VRFREFASPWFRYLMLRPGEVDSLVDGSPWGVRRILTDATPRFAVVLEKRLR
jgi:hypothetical protein